VAGIGNLFNSDDGFGPEVVRRMHERADEDVRVVDYGIRGMHLAYDLLDGYDALVIVDAVAVGDEVGDLTVLEVGPDQLGSEDFDPHGMNPVAVLASLGPLGGTVPRTYVVGCRPASTEEGIGLSDVVAAAVPRAVETVDLLLDDLLVREEA
jgi:hydrogenase maturation protease